MVNKLVSWRTLVFGVVSGLSMICKELSDLLDNDPATLFSFADLIAGVGMLGLGYTARDNVVTSEQTGAK